MGKLSLKELLKGVINENDQIKSDDLDKLIDRLEILGKKVESEYVPRSTTRRSKVKQGCKMIGECLPGQMIKTRSDQVCFFFISNFSIEFCINKYKVEMSDSKSSNLSTTHHLRALRRERRIRRGGKSLSLG